MGSGLESNTALPSEVMRGTPSCKAYQEFKSGTVGSFYLSDCAAAGNTVMRRHSHAGPTFVLVISGAQVESVEDGRRVQQEPMSVTFHPAGREHENRMLPAGCRAFRLEAPDALMDRLSIAAISRAEEAHFFPYSISHHMLQAWSEFYLNDSLTPLALEESTLAILDTLTRKQITDRRSPTWFSQVLEMLQDYFIAPPSVADIARQVDVHATHLARTFRKYMDCTIAEYLRRLRVSRACELLVNRPDSLIDIADLTGFYDQAHFTRSFKRIVGMTPGAFRRTMG